MNPTSCRLLAHSISVVWFIFSVLHPAASQSGFYSVDCGLSSGGYEDMAGITWEADGELWPSISNFSIAAAVILSDNFSSENPLSTLRFFPSTSTNTTKSSFLKFCYELPAVNGSFYLLRATFWIGSALPDGYPRTRLNGAVSFRVIVDTYAGVEVKIRVPQSFVWYEEMYVRAVGSSVSLCLSTASDDSSDTPFVNSIELRLLDEAMAPIKMVSNTGIALRMLDREDFGALSTTPPLLRYPDDEYDRLWFRSTSAAVNTIAPNQTVSAVSFIDSPPEAMLETCFVASTLGGYVYNVTTASSDSRGVTVVGSHRYFLNLWFSELDSRVNASGQRVFNVTTNSELFDSALDVFNGSGGLYLPYGEYTSRPLGPYTDYFEIKSISVPGSLYPATVAGVEILQLLDVPIAAPAASADVVAVKDLISSLLGITSFHFLGDPCLPSNYGYPWIKCSEADSPPRVTSISLSNYNTAHGKTIPTSINDLEFVTRILLSGNALEGPIPDVSNLVNLQVLDLSNNSLNGSIPISLAYLPKLNFIDLRNNNFSGSIPTSLEEKQGLTLLYDGNYFLCSKSNATCASSANNARKNNTPLLIGVVVGLVAFFILLCVVILYVYKHRRIKSNPLEQGIAPTSTNKYQDGPHVVSQTQVIEAANVARAFKFQEIIIATKNFSIIIGKGGFGFVYKGTLESGLHVAIKVLSDASQQGEHEFLNEVSLLSRVHHKKLVGLMGYCIEKKLVLVYEYMPNGSLFDALFGNTLSIPLKWIERLQILLDAAQGLAYLHYGCNSLIIHRDVKSSNILSTKNLEGKLSDFGISRLTSNDGNALTTRLLGTMGYLDPQYASTLRLSEKVDVYSFGVVMFETICGQPPLIKYPHKDDGEIHIVEWVRPFYEQGLIQEFVDFNMGKYNIASIWKVVEVAMACVQFDDIERPTMNEVCSELAEALRLESNFDVVTFSPMNTGEGVGLLSSSFEVKAR